MSTIVGSGLFKAIIDAIHGSDDRIAGQAITTLRVSLDGTETAVIQVESTVGFGELTDGAGDARLVIDGEIIDCSGRTLTTFTGLTRGVASTIVGPRYPAGSAIVYDYAQNSSALDHVRRGVLVNYAIGEDLDRVARNLGLVKCSPLPDDTWRRVIKAIAYLAKQPMGAIETALQALLGPGGYVLYERSVSAPHRFFVGAVLPFATSLQGRFVLNSGEGQEVEPGGIVNVEYPIVARAYDGVAARGTIRVVSPWTGLDGQQFVLNDGVNPAVTFEFDDDASVVQTPTLRAITHDGTETEQEIRDLVIAAITAAPTLAITPSALDASTVALLNDAVGAAGNQVITETVTDPVFVVSGMSGGVNAGTRGVLGVYLDNPLTQAGIREGFANLFTGGSFIGSQITLGTDPGTGIAVIVDYNGHPAHYLAPDASFDNDGTDFPPYFADNLGATRCVLNQVRAAGVGVELSAINP